jgi:hypothetical protein
LSAPVIGAIIALDESEDPHETSRDAGERRYDPMADPRRPLFL